MANSGIRSSWLWLLLLILVEATKGQQTFRASLHHVDAGLSRPEKIQRGLMRSKRRLQAMNFNVGLVNTSMDTRKLEFESRVRSAIDGAEYTMEIEIGTPLKAFSTVMDTGSDLIWVGCKTCSACDKKLASCSPCSEPLLDPSGSSSFQDLACSAAECPSLPTAYCSQSSPSCHFNYAYADGTFTRGDYSKDILALNSTSGISEQFHITLGCGHIIAGSFSGATGLSGLGQGSLSLISQIPALNGTFSYCLADTQTNESSPLFLGSTLDYSDPSVSSTPILFNSSRTSFYFVQLESVLIGSTTITKNPASLDLNSRGTIFDSGTTLTYFENSIYVKLLNAFSNAVPNLPRGSTQDFDLCFDISTNPNYQFPNISLQFNGALFSPPVQNYMLPLDAEGRIWCLLFASSGDISQGIGIVGNLMQQNFHVGYDTIQMKISFTRTNCSAL